MSSGACTSCLTPFTRSVTIENSLYKDSPELRQVLVNLTMFPGPTSQNEKVDLALYARR